MTRTATTSVRSRKPRRAQVCLGKANGVLDKRVQEVGPERFGIVSVDCAKQRSRWMLCDFYGRVLLAPASVEHTGPALRTMIDLLRHAAQQHQLGHVLVAVERTGNHHRPVQRACREAGFETRIVHPFASKKFREAEHPQDKTDDHDLGGIHRATVVGFGLIEQPLDETYLRLRLLVRHRRDLVRKAAAVQCQIREHLQATLPGLTALFDDDKFWTSAVAMPLARRFAGPEPIRQLGLAGVAKELREAGVRFQQRSIEKIVLTMKMELGHEKRPPRIASNERNRVGTTRDTPPNAAIPRAGSEPSVRMPNGKNSSGSLPKTTRRLRLVRIRAMMTRQHLLTPGCH